MRSFPGAPTAGRAARAWTPTSTAATAASAAFTLIELLVVLVILALGAVLLLPRAAALLAPRDLGLGEGRLAEAVTSAREAAMLEGAAQGLVLDLDAGLFWSQDLASLVSQAAAGTLEPPERAESPPNGAKLSAVARRGAPPVTSGRTVIAFLPLGLAEPCALTLTGPDKEERLLYLMAGNGRLRTANDPAEARLYLGFDPGDPTAEATGSLP